MAAASYSAMIVRCSRFVLLADVLLPAQMVKCAPQLYVFGETPVCDVMPLCTRNSRLDSIYKVTQSDAYVTAVRCNGRSVVVLAVRNTFVKAKHGRRRFYAAVITCGFSSRYVS